MRQTPQPYRSTCASVVFNNTEREVKVIYQVIDTSDGDAVINTFRNGALAERAAESSPSYRVREYIL